MAGAVNREIGLPPKVPTLADLSPTLAGLFERAFTGSTRPTATDERRSDRVQSPIATMPREFPALLSPALGRMPLVSAEDDGYGC